MAVKKGDKVVVDYEGRFDTGEVFDSSRHGDHSHPIEFEVGAGMVIGGFDSAVVGMNKGDKKEFTLTPEQGYGQRNEELKKEIPRASLPQDHEPKVGMVLVMKAPTGQELPVRIVAVAKDTITIDLNHPLAGKTLIFKIELTDIK